MGFILCLFALLSLTLGVACRPISSVRLSPNETKSFSSECSVDSTLTVKYDQQSGTIKCTFISHELPPLGVLYRQTTTSGNRTVESTVNCSTDGRKCSAVADVGDFVNCSMVFNAMNGRFMSCFNYSFPVDIEINSTSEFVPPTSENKCDMLWLMGLFSLVALVVTWVVIARCFYKYDGRLERLKKGQENLKIQIEATNQSPPLSRRSLNSASGPHGELSQRLTVMTAGSTVFRRNYNSDAVSEFELGDLTGTTSLDRNRPHLPADDSSNGFNDTTTSFTIDHSEK